MSMGAFDRNIKKLAAKNIGGADTPADYGCSGAINTCIRALGAPKAKFHNTVSFGSIADPGGLGGNQALMIDNV